MFPADFDEKARVLVVQVKRALCHVKFRGKFGGI